MSVYPWCEFTGRDPLRHLDIGQSYWPESIKNAIVQKVSVGKVSVGSQLVRRSGIEPRLGWKNVGRPGRRIDPWPLIRTEKGGRAREIQRVGYGLRLICAIRATDPIPMLSL